MQVAKHSCFSHYIITGLNHIILKMQKIEPTGKKFTTNDIILRIKIERMIKRWKKKVKKSKHRLNILKQWAQTQKAYIDDLTLIIQKIQKPFQQQGLIDEQEDRILFPNLQSMKQLSSQLLKNLNSFIDNWHPHKTMIGEVVINYHKYFIIYREYCNNFMKGQVIVKQIRKKPEGQKIQSGLMMDIESYIIKPVQRPPKYQLLLRQYKKALDPKHADYENLAIAIEKYHDVNEENNQSMELQIKNQMMINLDRKYGGIISSTRVYLFEEIAQYIQFKVKLYIFNDLIVVVKVFDENKQEGFKKIFLDGESFVTAPMDGKYFINKLFICGAKDNIHVNFFTLATRDRVYEVINRMIFDLYDKADKRKSLLINMHERKRAKTKVMITQLEEIKHEKITYQPKLRVTVVGVEKRPMSTLSNKTVYILKIQTPYPCKVFQYSYLPFEELVQFEKELRKKYKLLYMPVLDDRPETLTYYDVKKNKTKIIEYRQIYIERFLNYIIRSDDLIKELEDIANRLRVNYQLWKYVTSENDDCNCPICTGANRTTSTLKNLEDKRETARSVITQRKTYQTQDYQSVQTRKDQSNFCIFNSFLMTNLIGETAASELDNLTRRLTWLDCNMGRMDYSIMPKPQDERSIKIHVYLLSLKENDFIQIYINKFTTVQQIVDQIAVCYKIDTLRDFGLFIDYQCVPRLLDRDEKIYDILTDISYDFAENKKSEDTSFWQNILKKGEDFFSKKSKIYLKKYLFVQNKLEIQACRDNPQRYSLIVEEVFYRYKNETLILSINDSKKLCALYYILNNLEKVGHLSANNFQVQKLKALIPESRWNQFDSSHAFEKDVFKYVNEFQEKLIKASMKVDVMYERILELVHDVLGWNSLFFDVTNYDPGTLPGNASEVLLGINRHNLTIIRPKTLAPLLEISLLTLEYKVTAFSIFITTEQRVLRFDGRMMYDIKKLIKMYQKLANKFDIY